jgi:hypothetical protein
LKRIGKYLLVKAGATMLAAIVVLMALSACVKYTATCELVVMPRRMPVESSPTDGAAHMVRIYVIYIGKGKINENLDIKDWRPMSYSDAEAGMITNTKTGGVKYASLYRQQGDDSYVRLPITSSPAVLVAVNEMDEYYAWRYFEYEVPMPRMEIVLRFMLWKSTDQAPLYSDSEWTVGSAAWPDTP